MGGATGDSPDSAATKSSYNRCMDETTTRCSMRAWYRGQAILGHRRPGRRWYTVEGCRHDFRCTAEAMAWIDGSAPR